MISLSLVTHLLWVAASQTTARDSRGLIAEAQSALDGHDDTRAEALAAQATLAGGAVQAWLILGMARFRQGHFEPSRAAFQFAVGLAPTSATAEFDLGSALFELGRLSEASAAYLAAADLDATIAPLAIYDAGFAALKLDQLDQALALFRSARDQASARGQPALVQKATDAIQACTDRRSAVGLDRMRQLAKQASDDLRGSQFETAKAHYTAALAEATAIGASPADQAELHFGLGYAELEGADVPGSLRDFDEAVHLAPSEAPFHFMLGLAEERSGRSAEAWSSFQQSLALGLPKEDRDRAERYLDVLWDRRLEWRKVELEAHVGTGYDTDVPESGTVATVSSAGGNQTSAPYVSADVDAEWRFVGNDHHGLALDYRFSQLAYLSGPTQLDIYSLQEHALALEGVWQPVGWLSLSAEVQPFVQFEGIATYGPFQDGVRLEAQAIAREGRSFETSVRYAHTFKQSLDPDYDYLAGNRDDVWVRETLLGASGRLWIGYRFELERVGNQSLPADSIAFPCPAGAKICPPPSTENYIIPYSYASQEASIGAALNLPWALRASLDLRYEYRPYPDDSYLQGTGSLGLIGYKRFRTDNRYTVEASIRRSFGRHFLVALQYSVFVNTSNIDNTQVATALDYDDKNYVKQVAEVSVGTEW